MERREIYDTKYTNAGAQYKVRVYKSGREDTRTPAGNV